MDAERRAELLRTYRDGLLNDVMPFWLTHAPDQEFGGVLTCLDRDGTVIDSDKGVWQQGRAAWLFGELYNKVEPRSEWLEVARSCVQFMDRYCFDPSDGRMWFHVTREGKPIRKRRYAYTESFAAIAYGELAKATESAEFAEKARRLFHRFTDHHGDARSIESKFTSTRPTRSIGIPMITITTAQELRESIGLDDADAWIDRSIDVIRSCHVKHDIECVMETVDVDGECIDHFDGRTLNPGHAMEAAWFIMWEGRHRGDPELVALGCRMLDWMWHRGWDEAYGGMLYFVDVNGLPVQEYWHDMKFWWPHNETIIATLLAWLLTGEQRYLDWHAQVHEWAFDHFPDPEFGEWFGYLHRDGRLSVRLKGNLWKGAFHLPRMLLRCWQLLKVSA
jgi:N-acylglucosamine 2-epimerase